jgi:hypothetical protein
VTAGLTLLPADVQRIIHALAAGPSNLLDHRQTAITAAFDHGLIQASAWVGQGHTMYSLRKQPAVTP